MQSFAKHCLLSPQIKPNWLVVAAGGVGIGRAQGSLA
jgi:hypothetical protein